MEKEMYHLMYETETYHWYFKAKYEIVLKQLEKYGITLKSAPRIVDFGCGCGVMLKYLSAYGEVEGIDFSSEALQYCKRDFNGILRKEDLEHFHNPKKYDFGVALDVIEHIDNDKKALFNMSDSMNTKGICIFTVPAFMHLWSAHDKNCMHVRRYSKSELMDVISKSGFEVLYCSYYNFWFYLPVFFIRSIENFFKFKNKGSKLEYGFKEGYLNTILYKIFSSEKRRILRAKSFPFGVSLICIAQKKGN